MRGDAFVNTSGKYHIYNFDEQDIKDVFKLPVFLEVIRSSAFNRLKSINFLGAIDYLFSSNGPNSFSRHSRFNHSLAVANLAQRYCQLREISGKDREYCVVAALLHDIGHAPLSHSLEPAFKSIFQMDHHRSGEAILRGDVRIGEKLSEILVRYDLNNFRVMSIINGTDETMFNDIFARSINVDTIDGILRSAKYIYRADFDMTAVDVIGALATISDGSESVLDSFWMLKNEVYDRVIQSDMGLMADYLCKRYMEKYSGKFRSSYYFGTEAELRADHKELFNVLENFSDTGCFPERLVPNHHEMSFFRRTFYVDKSVKLESAVDLNRRYRQRKDKRTVTIVKKRGRYGLDELPEYQGSMDLFK